MLVKRLALPLLFVALALVAWVLMTAGGPDSPPLADGGPAAQETDPGAGAGDLSGASGVRTEVDPHADLGTQEPAFTGARELGIPSFTGTLLGSDGEPLANVAVAAAGLIGWSASASAPDRAERLAAEFTARSGADGRFALPEAPRDGLRFEILFSHAGHAPLRLLNQPAWPGRTRDLGELRLTRGFALSGRVLAPDGSPVAGAEILAFADPALSTSNKEVLHLDPLPGMSAWSDREGEFRLERLPPGRIRVRATAAGFGAPWSPPLTAQEGEELTDLVLQLRSGRVMTGIVLDAARQAVPGAAIRARASTSSPWPNHQQESKTTSDVGGGFSFFAAEDFTALELLVSAPGHSLVRRNLRPADLEGGPLEILIQILPQVRGFVVDESGAAVAGAQVILTPQTPTPFHPRDRLALAAATSGADGAFTLAFDIGLLDGASRVDVWAWDDAHAPAAPARLDLRGGKLDPAAFPLRLILPAGLTLSGRALAADGAALAGARIHLRKLQAPRANRMPTLDAAARGGTVVARAAAGADGEFRFGGLAPGDYRVEAHHASCSPGESADLALLEDLSDLEVRLPARSGIAGSVEGELRAFPSLQVLASAPGRETLEAAVDPSGQFRFENLAPDTYSLALRPAPWGGGVQVFSFGSGQPLARLEELTVPPGATVPAVLRLELESFGQLEGRVLAGGAAAVDYGVFLFPSGLSPDSDPSLSARQQLASMRRSTTDRDGRFAFAGLEAREWLVVICQPGGEPDGLRSKNFPESVRGLARRRVTVGAGGVSRADFELRSGTLVIEVSNAAERVAEREITLQPQEDAGTVRSVVVGRKGARLTKLPSGTYAVTLSGGATTATPNVFVPPEGTATLKIELPVRPPRRD